LAALGGVFESFFGMMTPLCPYCCAVVDSSDSRPSIIAKGFFYRKSDSRRVRRFQCRICQRHFSLATFHAAYRQKKRQKNDRIRRNFASGFSIRRMARELHLSRTTVARKLRFLGNQASMELRAENLKCLPAKIVEFDDQETFEHTKCKPLSITWAVESGTRRILGFSVSQMQAKGHLAKIAKKKYGPRKDTRQRGREELFRALQDIVEKEAIFKSDENPHYGPDLKRYFPLAKHETSKGQRGAIVGQGELKKVKFDPLFSLNHTCAMTRANVNRLARRTWCTTKIPARLHDHLAIYAVYHNEHLNLPPIGTAKWASS